MKLFRDMDLYKAIIFVSLLLIPAAFYFVYWVEGRLEKAETRIAQANSQNGELVQIGLVQKQLQTLKKSASRQVGAGGHRVYFQNQILKAAKSGIKATDLQISNVTDRRVGRSKALDKEVTISFVREAKPLALPREFLNVALYYCETGASRVWKLRDFKIRNEDTKAIRADAAPPRTVSDNWFVDKFVFARREPDSSRKPGR